MFNKFKFSRDRTPKPKKEYAEYKPGEESNFSKKKRGFGARPDLFQAWHSFFTIRQHNPFRIRDYETFDKEPQSEMDKMFM
mmetsp:Transcript_18728/g.32016  ORF Transcript_18728/g.32016 Transcript_18728/m.32016 type:complete len:81 (+) Transcript_18728:713-955(+)